MGDALEFTDVYSIVRGALNAGRLKLTKTGAAFKSTKTGKVESVGVGEIEAAHWMRVARGFGLKLLLKNGQSVKFDGFKEVEYDKVKEFILNYYKMQLEEVELCVKGWNWGTAKFKGSVMTFEVDKKPAFEIPLKDVSQGTTGKNEVTIEFHRSEDAKVALMEMRFYVPSGSDDASSDPVKAFHQQIMSKADIIQVTGDAIIEFAEVACLTPRGRYSIKVYPTFLQLHGKTYDYKIPHTTILRLFLLPHQDIRFMFFVVSMDPPIRQGQTRYPFLILQFERDEEITCKLNLTEEEIESKYSNKLKQEMHGALFEVVSRVLKEVCGRKITVPGNFKGHTGTNSVTCSYKAGAGLLYPLERGFMFVHKPPVHIRFDEIANVNFARGSTTGRTFDFELELKNGSQVVFSNLPRDEYSHLFDFVNQKQLRIRNKGSKKSGTMMDELVASDEDEHDFYLQKVKAEGAEKDEDEGENDDSEDEEDEDFNPSNEKVDDVKEEFDSNPETSESEENSDADVEEKKQKKKKKEKDTKSKEGKNAEKGSSGTGKKKGKKDKDAPKRPMTAFMLWLSENRERIKKSNPGATVADVAKAGGEMWKSVHDKTEWEEKAKDEKAKYEVAVSEYRRKLKESGKESTPTPKTGGKSIKDMIKKGSPAKRKSVEVDNKYKSKEFIDSDDDASSADDTKSPSPTKKSKPSKKQSEDEEDDGSEDDDDGHDEEKPTQRPESKAVGISARRGKGKQAEELMELPDDSEEEAEFSGGSSAKDSSSEDEDD